MDVDLNFFTKRQQYLPNSFKFGQIRSNPVFRIQTELKIIGICLKSEKRIIRSNMKLEKVNLSEIIEEVKFVFSASFPPFSNFNSNIIYYFSF